MTDAQRLRTLQRTCKQIFGKRWQPALEQIIDWLQIMDAAKLEGIGAKELDAALQAITAAEGWGLRLNPDGVVWIGARDDSSFEDDEHALMFVQWRAASGSKGYQNVLTYHGRTLPAGHRHAIMRSLSADRWRPISHG
jgi:hypothetical protein